MHFGEEAAENVLVYEDEGFSGGNLERPQFKKMMKDSQKIAFAAIGQLPTFRQWGRQG